MRAAAWRRRSRILDGVTLSYHATHRLKHSRSGVVAPADGATTKTPDYPYRPDERWMREPTASRGFTLRRYSPIVGGTYSGAPSSAYGSWI